MTNFERYKNEIKEMINNEELVAVSNGKPVACTSVENCKECDFAKKENSCMWHVMKWLYEEYQEPKINLPDDIKVDTPILVSHDGEEWHKRYFAKIEMDNVCTWLGGATSWSTDEQNDITAWQYAKLPDEVE